MPSQNETGALNWDNLQGYGDDPMIVSGSEAFTQPNYETLSPAVRADLEDVLLSEADILDDGLHPFELDGVLMAYARLTGRLVTPLVESKKPESE